MTARQRLILIRGLMLTVDIHGSYRCPVDTLLLQQIFCFQLSLH